MFKKNLEVLKFKNPDLAGKLEAISLESIKSIGVLKAESKDLIITYNKVPLHNLIDPLREAKTVWNKTIRTELKRNDIQIVFGLGLGYLFKRAYVNGPDSKIFLYEPFIEILRYVLEYVDFSKELAENRVYITNDSEELLQKLQSEYLSGDKIEYLFLNSYSTIATDILLNLTKKTLKICEEKTSDQSTIFNLSALWTKNFILNSPYLKETTPLGHLTSAFAGKPALIISAGPSLADDIQKIKENKNKFITIAVAAAFKHLVEAGITPDFVCFADALYIAPHVEKYKEELSKTNLLITTRAENYIYQQKSNSKISYFTNTDKLAQWTYENFDKSIGQFGAGGTVSIAAYYLAKNLGCNIIAFSGLDLAFIGNKMYANGQDYEVDNSGNIKFDFFLEKKLTYVKSVKGEMIPSRDDYALFIRHFESIFTDEENPAKIINTSTSGALINGMTYMSFDDFVKDLPTQQFNVNEELSKISDKNNASWSKSNHEILKAVKVLRNDISELNSTVCYLNKELQSILELFNEYEKHSNTLQTKLASIKDDLTKVRDTVLQNPFLSNYLQFTLWNYAKSYKTSLLPSVKDIKSNVEVELTFVNSVEWATVNITKWFNEADKANESNLVLEK